MLLTVISLARINGHIRGSQLILLLPISTSPARINGRARGMHQSRLQEKVTAATDDIGAKVDRVLQNAVARRSEPVKTHCQQTGQLDKSLLINNLVDILLPFSNGIACKTRRRSTQ